MKAKLIKRAALAAAILAGVSGAYGASTSITNAVVFCKATISSVYHEDGVVSVTLPPTEGYYDDNGNPLTYWNVGNVPAGGVADSWHGEGGPGRFTAHNEGSVGAYVYVTTCMDNYFIFNQNIISQYGERYYQYSDSYYSLPHIDSTLLGANLEWLQFPAISPTELRRWNENWCSEVYHLAFTTDVTAKVPTWHSLDHRHDGTGDNGIYWSTEEISQPVGGMAAGYMGYVDAGDYLTFDLKFWAPRSSPSGCSLIFTFCVEASSFPLWDHGRAVE